MLGMVYPRPLEAGGGIAVLAARGAGVIGADIFADHAPAGRSLRGIHLVGHINAKYHPDVLIIHTFARTDPILSQIQIFGAAGDFHPVVGCGSCSACQYTNHSAVCECGRQASRTGLSRRDPKGHRQLRHSFGGFPWMIPLLLPHPLPWSNPLCMPPQYGRCRRNFKASRKQVRIFSLCPSA
jgi:hypothetical protein